MSRKWRTSSASLPPSSSTVDELPGREWLKLSHLVAKNKNVGSSPLIQFTLFFVYIEYLIGFGS